VDGEEYKEKYWRRDWQNTAVESVSCTGYHMSPRKTHEETMRRIGFVVEELKKRGSYKDRCGKGLVNRQSSVISLGGERA